MYFFVVFSFDTDMENTVNRSDISSALEELGLRFLIKLPEEKELINLPKNTFIGEYEYSDRKELKNMLYREITRVFHEHNISGNIFLSVSEKAVIGVDYIG
ncbi:MAG: hypothetical protein R6W70_02885 [bacterium]